MTKRTGFQACPLSRRRLLRISGGCAIAVAVAGTSGQALAQGGRALTPNAWGTIGGDGITTIMRPASEMGQGIMTALPAVPADEMDADWSKVRVRQSPSDMKYFG